jgi:hypothetical protein
MADRMIASAGFPAAAEWKAGHRVSGIRVRGLEAISPVGPWLVVSNPCGREDFLANPSRSRRRDIRIISSNIPYLRNNPLPTKPSSS